MKSAPLLLSLGFAASLTLASAPPTHAGTPPAEFTRIINTTDGPLTVDFKHYPIRHANFEVFVQQADGSYNIHNAAAPRTYLGTVRELPGAVACGLLRENDTLWTRIALEDGFTWTSWGGQATLSGQTFTPAWPTTTMPAGGAGSNVYSLELGIDSTHNHYMAAGGNPADALERIEFSVLATNMVFLRDMSATHMLGKIMLRANAAQDPYAPDGGNTGNLLNRVRSLWNAGAPMGTSHRLAAVIHSQANGGLAWVGAIGGSNRYSSNDSDAQGDFWVVFRHEVGHNWGSGHYEGGGNPEGRTIMSDNALSRFSSSELLTMITHRNNRLSHLEILGPLAHPVPPRANQVAQTFFRGQTTRIDPLYNDSDANGGTLSLHSFDSISARGGQLSRSVGTGPDGRDEILYTAPPGFQSGTDWFRYRIEDEGGLQAVGFVMLRPRADSLDLADRWPLNESSGTTAHNMVRPSHHGTHENGVLTGQPGAAPGTLGAAYYDGAGARTRIPAPQYNTNSITFTTWIRRSGNQATNTGLIHSSGTWQRHGLTISASHQLQYQWSNVTWSSGLVLPDNQWCLVALSVTPASATIYLHTPSGLQSASRNASHSSFALSSPIYLGWSAASDGNSFRGWLDDPRVFRGPLTAADIESLYQQALDSPDVTVESPTPGSSVSPLDVPFAASIATLEGLVDHVDFLDADIPLATADFSPWQASAPAIASGPRTVVARTSYGDWGYQSQSAPVSFHVTDAPPAHISVAASMPASWRGLIPGFFTFTRDVPIGSLTVPITIGGSAVASVDYTALPDSITFANGATTATLTVQPLTPPPGNPTRNVTVTIDAGPDHLAGTPGSATLQIDNHITSVAGGAWNQSSTWNSGSPAPTSGTQNTGTGYAVAHTVTSNNTGSNTQALIGGFLRVKNGGVLDLARLHAFTNQNVTYNLPTTTIEDGGTVRFRASTGSSTHFVAADINVSGTTTFAFNSGAYANEALLGGIISGGGLIRVVMENNVSRPQYIRQLTLTRANNPFSGDWVVEHLQSGNGHPALRAAAGNAVGTGTVTLGRHGRLINDNVSGLNSLAGVIMNGEDSRLELNQRWNNSAATLALNGGSPVVQLGNTTSQIGSLSGTAGLIRGSGASSNLVVNQTFPAQFSGVIGENLTFTKSGPATLGLLLPPHASSRIAIQNGRLNMPATGSTVASLQHTGGTLGISPPASGTPALTVTGNYSHSGGDIVVTFASATPVEGVPYTLVAYQGTLTGEPAVIVEGVEGNVVVDHGTGSNSAITLTVEPGDYELNLVSSPEGAGAVTGGGPHTPMSTAAISATALPGWAFVEWIGSGIDDPAATQTFVEMDQSKTITARFERTENTTLVWRGDDAGLPNRWDVGTTTNWINDTIIDFFQHGDSVRFDDTAATFTPEIHDSISAGEIVFDHSAHDITLAGPGGLDAADSLVKRGDATLTLASANTFTGPITIEEGRMRLANSAALGSSASGAKTITISENAQLDLNGYNNAASTRSYSFSIAGDGPDASGALVNNGAGIASNAGILNLTLTGDAAIAGSGRFDIGRVNGEPAIGSIIGNGHTLTKTGTNDIMLRGDATPTPLKLIVASGLLGAENHDGALGGATGNVSVLDGAALGVWGARTLATPVLLETGATLRAMGGGVGTWIGPIALAGDATVDLDSDGKIISGVISGPGTLFKSGGNALTLSGNNTHTGGTTITLGQVNVTSNTAFGSGPVTFLRSTSSSTITRANLVDVTIANDITLNSAAATGFRGVLNTGAGNTLSELSGTITVASNVGNGGHFSANDGGVLRLSGTLATTGPIPNLRSGIIEMATTGGNLSQLGQGEGTTRLAADNGIQPTVRLNLAISNPGILDLNGFDQTLAEIRRANTHAATVTNTAETPSSLTIDGEVDHEFSGTIADGTGGISLIKRGSSAFTLSGSVSYQGDTIIEDGTLALGSASLADTSAIHITTGATLHLPHGEKDTIAELWIDGLKQPAGTYDANNTPVITGTGSLLVTEDPSESAYDNWLAAADLTPGAPGTGPLESHDGSGVANLIQFALGGDPNDPSANGIHLALDAGHGVTDDPMLITIAVHEGADFAGSPTPTATLHGITYSIQGTYDLHSWAAAAEEVEHAHDGNGAAAAPPGYELKTFRLVPGQAAERGGFLRVRISSE